MKANLPKQGIVCVEIQRTEQEGEVVSASTVRQAIHDRDFESVKKMVPDTTYAYFVSDEAAAVCRRIQAESNVIHY